MTEQILQKGFHGLLSNTGDYAFLYLGYYVLVYLGCCVELL